MSDQGPEAPKDYAETIKSAAGSALDQAQGAYSQASGQVQSAADRAGDLIRDQPLIAVGAAFVIGIVVGHLIARS